jgi:hypothetical protein
LPRSPSITNPVTIGGAHGNATYVVATFLVRASR